MFAEDLLERLRIQNAISPLFDLRDGRFVQAGIHPFGNPLKRRRRQAPDDFSLALHFAFGLPSRQPALEPPP